MSPILLLAASCTLVTSGAPASHPVSLTRAYVYVSREQAAAKIEVFLEDLFLFHDLKPNDQDFLEPDVIRRGMELHEQFIAERFRIRDVGGVQLIPRIIGVTAELPDEGVPLAELMAHRLTFEMEYDFAQAPNFLTISQHFTDEDAIFPAEMQLVIKQEGAVANQTFELRANDIEHIRLDWERPPLSAEASAEERAAFASQQQEETLGITSYSSVYSFLYIDDYEIRHEILIPLLTLEESVLIARDDDEFLDLAEQKVARRQVEAYFSTGNPVEINGTRAEAQVQRCDFYGLDFKDFARQAPQRPVPLVSARVGIILSYRVSEPLEQVKLTWNRFNDFIWTVNTVVFAYEQTIKTTLTRLLKRNVFVWKNPGRPPPRPPESVPVAPRAQPTVRIPALSLAVLMIGTVGAWQLGRRKAAVFKCGAVLAASAIAALLTWPLSAWHVPHPWPPPQPVEPQMAEAVFSQLHANLYRAFEFQEENAVYDALSHSIHGELLREVYLQVRRGLVMQEQGGAVSRIQQVAIVEGQLQPISLSEAPSESGQLPFDYQCRWNVAGTVEHWGHVHQRTNQYEGLFTIEPVDKVWKVTEMELLSEERIGFETRLRGS